VQESEGEEICLDLRSLLLRFPAQIETSASREVFSLLLKDKIFVVYVNYIN
jgi:hypothetical protein